MKVELNEVLINKGCINNYGNNYNIEKYVVVEKWLAYGKLTESGEYGVYEMASVLNEKEYNKFISGEKYFDDLGKSTYSDYQLGKYFVKSEEEYKEYYKSEIERIIENNKKQIETLNKNLENLKNILNN